MLNKQAGGGYRRDDSSSSSCSSLEEDLYLLKGCHQQHPDMRKTLLDTLRANLVERYPFVFDKLYVGGAKETNDIDGVVLEILGTTDTVEGILSRAVALCDNGGKAAEATGGGGITIDVAGGSSSSSAVVVAPAAPIVSVPESGAARQEVRVGSSSVRNDLTGFFKFDDLVAGLPSMTAVKLYEAAAPVAQATLESIYDEFEGTTLEELFQCKPLGTYIFPKHVLAILATFAELQPFATFIKNVNFICSNNKLGGNKCREGKVGWGDDTYGYTVDLAHADKAVAVETAKLAGDAIEVDRQYKDPKLVWNKRNFLDIEWTGTEVDALVRDETKALQTFSKLSTNLYPTHLNREITEQGETEKKFISSQRDLAVWRTPIAQNVMKETFDLTNQYGIMGKIERLVRSQQMALPSDVLYGKWFLTLQNASDVSKTSFVLSLMKQAFIVMIRALETPQSSQVVHDLLRATIKQDEVAGTQALYLISMLLTRPGMRLFQLRLHTLHPHVGALLCAFAKITFTSGKGKQAETLYTEAIELLLPSKYHPYRPTNTLLASLVDIPGLILELPPLQFTKQLPFIVPGPKTVYAPSGMVEFMETNITAEPNPAVLVKEQAEDRDAMITWSGLFQRFSEYWLKT